MISDSEKCSQLARVISTYQNELLEGWSKGVTARLAQRNKSLETEVRQQANQFLPLLASTLNATSSIDVDAPAWSEVRQLINEISNSRVRQGFSSTDTASFIFSLKEPLFTYLRTELGDESQALSEAVALTSSLFDRLGLLSVDAYQKTREQIIARQQQELLELSTPVVQLWQNIIALPLIGTLDSARTQVVMENLLQKVVETGAAIAIIDITGVPTVDTLVAQHLLKTISATRLMGADCIISGIRPQIAQTIVHLGVNLEDVITKATLADAFAVALQRTGSVIKQPA